MTEAFIRQPSTSEQLRANINRLFAEHADKIVLRRDNQNEHEVLHLVTHHPRQPIPSPLSHSEIPTFCRAHAITKTATGYTLRHNTDALVHAALTPAEQARLRITYAALGSEALCLEIIPYLERTWPESDKPSRMQIALSARALLFEDWLHILEYAEPYNADTHGILRHPTLPNGMRARSETIAPLTTIRAYKRQLWLEQQPPWRQKIGRLAARLSRFSPHERTL